MLECIIILYMYNEITIFPNLILYFLLLRDEHLGLALLRKNGENVLTHSEVRTSVSFNESHTTFA